MLLSLAMKTFYEQTNVMKIYLHRKKSSSPPALSLYFHLFQIVLNSIIVSVFIGAIGSMTSYRKIPKIIPGAYIFQRPFLRGLFLEGLIFGGAYLRREICVSKSIGLALYLEVNLPFLLCFTLYLRAIFQVQDPGGLIFGGAI